MEKKLDIIKPLENELPSFYADRLGSYYASKATDTHKKDNGQFFTPQNIADFMSSFIKIDKEKIKILDPGCGIGILSAALIERIVARMNSLKVVELVAFETDVEILPFTEYCFEYLRFWLQNRGIDFTFFLCKNDFILHNSLILNNNENSSELYDIVISNPPYFKLPKDDERIKIVKSVIFGQSNIYTIFLLVAAKLLKEDGELVFITPRSFCSGSYFRLFRELFFSIVDLKSIHLFDSRTAAFKRDKILLENIIISASKKKKPDPSQMKLSFNEGEQHLVISNSAGIDDISKMRIKKYKISELINFNSFQKILHLPSNNVDVKVIAIFKTWNGSLKQYNLGISTGPVVDFRSQEMIKFKKNKNTVPLFWLHNVNSMELSWPKNKETRGKLKGQYILDNNQSSSRLIKNKNLVLVRRFSTKDDNRRLIATPYFSSSMPNFEMIGIENHLNYIYHQNGNLDKTEALGIAAILNSKLFDIYFRTFNGNINVSATELRDFPLPDLNLIKIIGQRIEIALIVNQKYNIDDLVSEIFNLKIDLSKIYE